MLQKNCWVLYSFPRHSLKTGSDRKTACTRPGTAKEEEEEEEEEEEFICQVCNNNNKNRKKKTHWQVAMEGIHPSMLAAYDKSYVIWQQYWQNKLTKEGARATVQIK